MLPAAEAFALSPTGSGNLVHLKDALRDTHQVCIVIIYFIVRNTATTVRPMQGRYPSGVARGG